MAIAAMLRVSLGGNVAVSYFLVFHWFIVHPEHDNVECGTKKNKLYNACYPNIGVYETSMTTHLRYTEVIWYSTEVYNNVIPYDSYDIKPGVGASW